MSDPIGTTETMLLSDVFALPDQDRAEIALCSSVSITTAKKVPNRPIGMIERIASAIRSCSSL
jgi:hypothetical protein